MKLIVGLGNPGLKYKNTRHNVGFLVLNSFGFKWQKKLKYEVNVSQNESETIIYLKPLTYMNLSGDAVLEVVNFYKIKVDDILIVHDDMDLDISKFKLKCSKTGGGHNGIKSILKSLNTAYVQCLKIGIGRNNNLNQKDYVLSRLSKDEIKVLQSEKYRDIINYFIENGMEKTMNKYNKKEE